MSEPLELQCADCGAHFQVAPDGSVQGAACSECGGDRFYRHQPNPTQSDMAERNMVDNSVGVDRGGNSLGEGIMAKRAWFNEPCPHGQDPRFCLDCMNGNARIPEIAEGTAGSPDQQGVIMGDDGERPMGKRDNYMHGKVAEHWNRMGGSHVISDMTLNMEPYAPLWDESYVKEAAGGGLGGGSMQYQGQPGVDPNIFKTTPGEDIAALAPFALALAPEAVGALGLGGAADTAAGDVAAGGESAAGGGMGSALQKGITRGVGTELGLHGMKSLMNGALGTGSGASAMQPITPPSTIPALGSVKNIPEILAGAWDSARGENKSVDEHHDSPEDQDQKEFNDGDKSPSNPKNPNNDDSGTSGEDGKRQKDEGYGFGPNSPALERAEMLMPLLLHYYESDESGMNDPLIRSLHEMLTGELGEGYEKSAAPEGHQAVQLVIQKQRPPKHSVVAPMPAAGSNDGMAPSSAVPSQNAQPVQAQCPTCGGMMAPNGTCPNCSNQQDMMQTQMPAGSQAQTPAMGMLGRKANKVGPVTPEQKAAVAQLLITQKRADEIPNMELHPEQYARELDKIQGQPNTAPLVDPQDATPPPVQNPMGAMPVPDPSQPGGGGGMPLQPMAAYQMDPREMWEDSRQDVGIPEDQYPRPQIPDPHNPEYVYEMPTDLWNHEGMEAPAELRPAELEMDADRQNPQNPNRLPTSIPGLWDHDKYVRYIHDKGQFGSPHQGNKRDMRYADANNHVKRCPNCGSATTSVYPAQAESADEAAGRCHACNTIFPLDMAKAGRVLLTAVPAFAPEVGEMTWQDADGQPIKEGSTYEVYSPNFPEPDRVRVVSRKNGELGLKLLGDLGSIRSNANDMTPDFKIKIADARKYTFKPFVDDSVDEAIPSKTPGFEQFPPSGDTTDELHNSYPNPGTLASAVMSNDNEPVEDNNEVCHKCGCSMVDHFMTSAETMDHSCVKCGSTWTTVDRDDGFTATAANMDWVMETNEEFPTVDEHFAARTAGRKFTPKEQRELINERGSARNLSQLDLEGTHYRTRFYEAQTDAPEDHLVFGL